MSFKKISFIKVATIVLMVATLLGAGYIIFNHIGLVDKFDFGAGAYYYADIPNFDKLEQNATFISQVPMWVHIILFLIWGFLMYRLWLWVDKKSN